MRNSLLPARLTRGTSLHFFSREIELLGLDEYCVSGHVNAYGTSEVRMVWQ